MVMLKAEHIDVVAVGDVSAEPWDDDALTQRRRVSQWADPEHLRYVKMVTEGGVLTGFACVGMPRTAAELTLLYDRGGEVRGAGVADDRRGGSCEHLRELGQARAPAEVLDLRAVRSGDEPRQGRLVGPAGDHDQPHRLVAAPGQAAHSCDNHFRPRGSRTGSHVDRSREYRA
jgi:hypothetical protein